MSPEDVVPEIAMTLAPYLGCQDCGTGDGECPCRDAAIAIIRAINASGGLVVAQVPDNKRGDDDLSAYLQGVEVGWNNALTTIRASAVKP